MTSVSFARFSKPNLLEFDIKHCLILINDKCRTILIEDPIIAGLN